MNRGEIWFVSLDPKRGRELQGIRPVLIVSPDPFNALTRLPVCCPITNSGDFARVNGFAVSLDGSGLRTTGIVRCDQPAIVDLAARRANFVEAVPLELIVIVLRTLRPLFGT